MPTKPVIRAAAVQIAPDLTSRSGTIEKVLNAMSEAAGRGAEFIVFPETFVPYYPYFSFVQLGPEHLRLYEQAVVVPSTETDAVADAARKHRRAGLLGTLQTAGPLCADDPARRNPRRPFSRQSGWPDLWRTDRGDDAASRAGGGVFCGQRDGLAFRGADRLPSTQIHICKRVCGAAA